MAAPDSCSGCRDGRASMPRTLATPALGALLGLVVLTAAACSGSDDEAVAPRPTLPTTATALWNPCTALDLTRVERLLGTALSQEVGTADAPACRFTPADDGAPAVDVNYQLYDGSVDDLIKSFGVVSPAPGAEDDTTVTELDVPSSDGAVLVANVDDDDTLAVSGFVKNGSLMQLVNVIDPTPYDRTTVETAVTEMLGDLAARGDESGLSD